MACLEMTSGSLARRLGILSCCAAHAPNDVITPLVVVVKVVVNANWKFGQFVRYCCYYTYACSSVDRAMVS